jgi:hypothetical protein
LLFLLPLLAVSNAHIHTLACMQEAMSRRASPWAMQALLA